MMQEDLPLTFQDMQRASKEFEILGKQLNYLAGVVVSSRRRCGCVCVGGWGPCGCVRWSARVVLGRQLVSGCGSEHACMGHAGSE